MSKRQFATLRATTSEPKVRHLMGFPPELVPGAGEQVLLPEPELLVIDGESEQGFFLYRLTRSGEFGGDTWHASIEEALEQAKFEYSDRIGGWHDIPVGAPDACDYAVSVIRDGGNSDG